MLESIKDLVNTSFEAFKIARNSSFAAVLQLRDSTTIERKEVLGFDSLSY